MRELAQRRIAVSIAALVRLLGKPPTPPTPTPTIESRFLGRPAPRKTPGKDFKPF
jgi:outer membrane protein TolC